MSDELKPVPCGCGGRPIIEYGEDGICRVRCSFCLTGTVYHRNKAEAITAWNKAMGERTAKVTRKPEAFFYRCECGYGLCCEKNDMNYCPHCGGRLEWE